MKEWQIGIEPWIIEDGNYSHFNVGQTSEFGIEFFSSNLNIVKSSQKQAKHLENNEYEITGEVIYSNTGVLIIDFGLLAYRKLANSEKLPKIGDFVRGKVKLYVDPFFYFEELCKGSRMPPLIYTWKIKKITMISNRLKINKGKIVVKNGAASFEDKFILESVDNTRTSPKDFKYYFLNKDGTLEDHIPGSKPGGLMPNYSVYFSLHCAKADINPKYQRSGLNGIKLHKSK